MYFKQDYKIQASDYSEDFIKAFTESHDDNILKLGAVTIESKETYDCIYSSKVLNALDEDDIIHYLKRQYEILNDGGHTYHTLWYGDKTGNDSFIDKQTLKAILELYYEYVEFTYYKEADFIEAMYDSVILIAKKNKRLLIGYTKRGPQVVVAFYIFVGI